MLVLALVAGCKKSSDGRLSNSEMKEAAQDIVQLAHGAKAGDPTSANFSYEPKTQFGKDFKALFAKSAEIEKTMQGVLNSVSIEKILTPERLTSASGITESKADLKKLDDASEKYYSDTGKVAVEMIDLVSKASGGAPDGSATILQETRQIAEKSDQLWESCRKVIAVAEKGHPTLNSAKQLIFANDADIKSYNDAMSELQKVATDHDSFIAKILQERQIRFASGMSKLSAAQ